jgi:hypothetical protein
MSCRTEDKSSKEEQLPGVYLNTYSADVINPQTGVVIGSRTVKDSIFILESDGKYEISNRKWMYNDYDSNGWVTSMPGENESMQTYIAGYNDETGWLEPVEDSKKPPLFFEGNRLFRGELKALEYIKVEDVLE